MLVSYAIRIKSSRAGSFLILGILSTKVFYFLCFSHFFSSIAILFSILANCVRDESCTGKLAPIYPKSLKFVAQTDFCVYR